MPDTKNRGCLFLPGMLLGGTEPRRLTSNVSVPVVPHGVSAADRPTVTRVRRAAEAALSAMGVDAPAEVSAEVVAVVERVYALAVRLAEGRRFLVEHNPEALAKREAELEMKSLDADAVLLRALKAEQQALAKKKAHVGEIARQAAVMESRLQAAADEMEAFAAKVHVDSGSEDLLHELRAYQTSAEKAAEAYLAAAREVG